MKFIQNLPIRDRPRWEQVLRNVLSNVFKLTEHDGNEQIFIDIPSPNAAIHNANLCNMNEVLVYSISDTGIGIPAHKQGIVFEAFQQPDGSTGRKYGCSGPGLTISRQTAAALSGEIH